MRSCRRQPPNPAGATRSSYRRLRPFLSHHRRRLQVSGGEPEGRTRGRPGPQGPAGGKHPPIVFPASAAGHWMQLPITALTSEVYQGTASMFNVQRRSKGQRRLGTVHRQARQRRSRLRPPAVGMTRCGGLVQGHERLLSLGKTNPRLAKARGAADPPALRRPSTGSPHQLP
jgi:hypothetical protein